MTHPSIRRAALALAALGSLGFAFGGWAVVTVTDLPAAYVAGEDVSFEFKVRQHGVEPLSGLSPEVLVSTSAGGKPQVLEARPTAQRGTYAARFTVPRGERLYLSVRSGFRGGRPLPLLAQPVVSSAAEVAAQPAAAHGRRLFVAKGCVTCHTKSEYDELAAYEPSKVGPDLTNRVFPADWAAAKLRDPASRGVRGTDIQMPTLELNDTEIAALATFLNQREVARDP